MTSPDDIKPGDLFEWVYEYTYNPVHEDQCIYSDTMHTLVPVYGISLCVAVIDNVRYWTSNNRLYHAKKTNLLAYSKHNLSLSYTNGRLCVRKIST